jgi:hypothetical protein
VGAIAATSPMVESFRAWGATVDPKSASEQMLYATARITGILDQGFQRGTGFFYSVTSGSQNIILLVTNNHVVRGAKTTSFRLHTKSSSSASPDGHLEVPAPGDGAGAWVSHPDPNVDLCALPIGPILNSARPPAFIRTLGPSLIPTNDQLQNLDAIEDVVMVGYPIGMSDEVNDYPIFRKGITASDPFVDFNGKAETLVDIAAFPGSSGSPVFIYNNGMYAEKGGGTVVGSRLFFLGILYAGPMMAVDGSIVAKDIPTSVRDIPTVNVMINLGYIIKARQIDPLVSKLFQVYKISQ